MKIAVASDDGKTIAEHTGRCNYFVIFDISDGNAERIETKQNIFTPHMRGGQGGHPQPQMRRDGMGPHGSGGGEPHSVLLDALEDVEVLIARGMGPRLVNALESAGIRAVFTDLEDVDASARQFAEGELEELDKGTCDHS